MAPAAQADSGTFKPVIDELAGQTLLRRSVAAFDAHPDVESIVVVLPPDIVAEGASHVGPTVRPCRCVAGGGRRQDSVRIGLEAVDPRADVVLVHDAARPFVARDGITRAILGAVAHGAAMVAVAGIDTV